MRCSEATPSLFQSVFDDFSFAPNFKPNNYSRMRKKNFLSFVTFCPLFPIDRRFYLSSLRSPSFLCELRARSRVAKIDMLSLLWCLKSQLPAWCAKNGLDMERHAFAVVVHLVIQLYLVICTPINPLGLVINELNIAVRCHTVINLSHN